MSFMEKRFRPYAGIWIYCLTAIAVPILFYFFFHYILSIRNVAALTHFAGVHYRPVADAHFFSAIIGVGVCATSILSGALLRDFFVIVMRVSDLISDLRCGISFKQAVKWYKDDIKYEGAAFWILIVPIILNVVNLIISIKIYR